MAAILLLALTVRLWVVATHTYLASPDETFQYLEPAHRLAFGSGVITWEYIDGIRSWLLPGAIAGIMRGVALFASGPEAYVMTLRVLCVLASLAVPYAGYRLAERHAGREAAFAAGLLCAFWPQAVYFAPVIMTEPLATDAALLAIWLGDDSRSTRRLLLAGALFGLAGALRYQYVPVLGVVAVVQHARHVRPFLLVAAGGIAVVVLFLGVLDAATWGMPFHSVWFNYLRNGPQGVSSAMGAEPWSYYLEYFLVAWGALTPVLLVLAGYGAVRVPVLAVAAIGTIGLHALVPHKELRFIVLASACIPTLLGIGLASVLARLKLTDRRRGVAAAVSALAVALFLAVSTTSYATKPDAWHRDRSLLQATAAARAMPEVCGLAIRTAWVYRTGGYSYWHRDAPIYFETWNRAQVLPGSAFRLRLIGVLNGQTVPQYPGAAMAAHTGKFNAIVGTHTDGLPGFTEHSCYGAGTVDDPIWCLFTRPGGCG